MNRSIELTFGQYYSVTSPKCNPLGELLSRV